MVEYEITVPIKFEVPKTELNRVRDKVQKAMGSMSITGPGGPSASRGKSGLGGRIAGEAIGGRLGEERGKRKTTAGLGGRIAGEAIGGRLGGGDLAGSLKTGVAKLGAALLVIAVALKVITGILSNQFSALKDLLDVFGILFQLVLKPFANMAFAFLLPVLKALIPILPLWNDFVRDPAANFKPLFEALGTELAKAVAGIFGVDPQVVSDKFTSIAEIAGDVAAILQKLWTSTSRLVQGFNQMFGTIFNELRPELEALAKAIFGDLIPSIGDFANEVIALVVRLEPLVGLFISLTSLIIGLVGPLALPALKFGIEVLTVLIGDIADKFDLATGFLSAVNDALDELEITVGDLNSAFLIVIDSMFLLVEIIRAIGSGLGIGGPIGGIIGSITHGDFISRPGQAPVAFSPQDTIIGVKEPAGLGGGGAITINVFGLTSQELPGEIERILERQRRMTR